MKIYQMSGDSKENCTVDYQASYGMKRYDESGTRMTSKELLTSELRALESLNGLSEMAGENLIALIRAEIERRNDFIEQLSSLI